MDFNQIERTHTIEIHKVVELKKPETFIDDPITNILLSRARKLLDEALESEIESFIAMYTDVKNDQGRQRITWNGYLL